MRRSVSASATMVLSRFFRRVIWEIPSRRKEVSDVPNQAHRRTMPFFRRRPIRRNHPLKNHSSRRSLDQRFHILKSNAFTVAMGVVFFLWLANAVVDETVARFEAIRNKVFHLLSPPASISVPAPSETSPAERATPSKPIPKSDVSAPLILL